ncbi:MAG: hypothetical protein QW739_04165 [Candidatus Odinarchaeota archaeon]
MNMKEFLKYTREKLSYNIKQSKAYNQVLNTHSYVKLSFIPLIIQLCENNTDYNELTLLKLREIYGDQYARILQNLVREFTV